MFGEREHNYYLSFSGSIMKKSHSCGLHWTLLTSVGMEGGGWPIMKQWHTSILIFDVPVDPFEKSIWTTKHTFYTTQTWCISLRTCKYLQLDTISVVRVRNNHISPCTYCILSRITQLWIINEADLLLTRSTDRGKC